MSPWLGWLSWSQWDCHWDGPSPDGRRQMTDSDAVQGGYCPQAERGHPSHSTTTQQWHYSSSCFRVSGLSTSRLLSWESRPPEWCQRGVDLGFTPHEGCRDRGQSHNPGPLQRCPVTKEYMDAVIKAHEERDAVHAEEQERRKEAIKADNFGDPVIHLLHVTHKVVHTQVQRAVDTFLSKIESTLQKHIPFNTQGPLIVNALSTAFQFQMSVWRMIGEECVLPCRQNIQIGAAWPASSRPLWRHSLRIAPWCFLPL